MTVVTRSAAFKIAQNHRMAWKIVERVKGIEPSYSAWKAAALPLSYTRDTGSLTRPGGGLNCPQDRFRGLSGLAYRPGSVPRRRPLNSGRLPAYIDVFRNQRKEVIQCLLPSAVTSLGSPAKLWIRASHRGALSPGPASKKSGATGSPRRAFSLVRPLSLASRAPLGA
jgi:hypothetical protein